MSKEKNYQDEYESDYIVENYADSKLQIMLKNEVNVIMDLLKQLVDPGHGKTYGTLLDVGCGPGGSARLLEKVFDRAIGIDPSPNNIKKATMLDNPPHVEFKTGTGENMPVADDSIDVITSVLALHFMDVDLFIKECRRVLKENGVGILYIHYLSAIDSVEDRNLPTIIDPIKELREKSRVIAEAMSHPERHALDMLQTMYDSMKWPNKSKLESKVHAVTNLESLRHYYLSVPFYGNLGSTAENPMVKLFQDVEKLWSLDTKEKRDVTVRATFDVSVIILK